MEVMVIFAIVIVNILQTVG